MQRKSLFLASLLFLAGSLVGCSKPVTDASGDPPKGAMAAPMSSTGAPGAQKGGAAPPQGAGKPDTQ